MAYIDFADLKRRVGIEELLDAYDIPVRKKGKELRGSCPLCEANSERAFVATPGEELWHCFKCDKGGDIIKLIEFLKGMRPKEAALDIHERCIGRIEEPKKEVSGDLKPLTLLHQHELVQDLGIPVEVAARLGIGYCKLGIMRGRVAFPLRDESGKLVAYAGYNAKEGTIKMPKFPN